MLTMCNRKPNCSYNCLIGMALKCSESGRLPVGEIYRFFEREFPYFLSAAEPWKNSLRHSLSLGHYFRKFNGDKLVTKKGHLWEVDPQKASELDREMYMFLAKGMPEHNFGTSQLSKLQLHMTQLLFDSIRHNSSPTLNTPQRKTTGWTPKSTMKRHAALTPGTVDLTPKHGANIYPPSTILPAAVPRYVGGQMSPAFTQSSYRRSFHSPPPRIPKDVNATNSLETYSEGEKSLQSQVVSEEALQLVQFCNHCTFGLNPVQKFNSQSAQVEEASKSQNELNQPFNQRSPCIMHDEDENQIYPFIATPVGHQNLSLSQLNNTGFQSATPGPPKELTITKPKLLDKVDTTACTPQKSLDEAVRPIVYDWNSWWKEKRVVCMMNEESYLNYVECKCKKDIRKLLEKNSKRTKKTLVLSKKKDSLPAKDGNKSTEMTASSTKSSPVAEHVGYKRKMNRPGLLPPSFDFKNTDSFDSKEMDVCSSDDNTHPHSSSRLADICKNLKLIVSIQFCRLVTERQMKKYCWKGGKHRIPN